MEKDNKTQALRDYQAQAITDLVDVIRTAIIMYKIVIGQSMTSKELLTRLNRTMQVLRNDANVLMAIVQQDHEAVTIKSLSVESELPAIISSTISLYSKNNESELFDLLDSPGTAKLLLSKLRAMSEDEFLAWFLKQH